MQRKIASAEDAPLFTFSLPSSLMTTERGEGLRHWVDSHVGQGQRDARYLGEGKPVPQLICHQVVDTYVFRQSDDAWPQSFDSSNIAPEEVMNLAADHARLGINDVDSI